MTEQEWLHSTKLMDTLAPLLREPSSRRWRLFALACVRRILHLVPARFHHSLDQADLFVDRLITKPELVESWISFRSSFGHAQRAACWATCPTGSIADRAQNAVPYQVVGAQMLAEGEASAQALEAELCRYARDIFGNPFQSVPRIDPNLLLWGDGIVRNLARGIYEDRAFEQMPILADALEDAGCQAETMLEHCREGVVHVRGCWVVDLLLGRG